MASKVFAIGEAVWAHTGSEHSFEKGVVERLDGHKNTITIKIGKNSVDIKESDVHKTNADKQDGLPDNTYLRELNEATLLHNVRTRYNDKRDDGGCYSCTGHILIAVNPFRSLNIYEESNVRTRRIGHFVSCCATTCCMRRRPRRHPVHANNAGPTEETTRRSPRLRPPP